MNPYRLIITLLAIVSCQSISLSSSMTLVQNFLTTVVSNFASFSQSHNKKYTSANVAKYRQEVFNKNIQKVQGLNSSPNNSYPQGMTIYADLTEEEFLKIILNPKIQTTPDLMLKFQGLSGDNVIENPVANTTSNLTNKAQLSSQPVAPRILLSTATNTTNKDGLTKPISSSFLNNNKQPATPSSPSYNSSSNSNQSQSQSQSRNKSYSLPEPTSKTYSSSYKSLPSISQTQIASALNDFTKSKTPSSKNSSVFYQIISQININGSSQTSTNSQTYVNNTLVNSTNTTTNTTSKSTNSTSSNAAQSTNSTNNGSSTSSKNSNSANANSAQTTNTTIITNTNITNTNSKNSATTNSSNSSSNTTSTVSKTQDSKIQTTSSPPAVDWRKNKKVSRVKMQGSCGNCYSFSTTGALESAYMIKYNTINVSYSEQQITDCCGVGGFGCNGCSGGWQWQALKYIQKNGIVTEDEYQTVSSDLGEAGECQKIYSPKKILNQKTPFIALTPGNTTALYEAVTKQPVSVGVDASYMQFLLSSDSTEIFSNCSSAPQDANHAMLVVGYDGDGNWILKNSWGEFWGDGGYIKIKAGNTCGVSNFALYPILI